MQRLSDKQYNSIFSKVPRFCIDLIMVTPKGILLGKRKISPYKGKYSFPGGMVKFGETFTQAVQRIAVNEIGCTVQMVKMVGAMEFLKEIQNDQKRHSVSIAFTCIPNCKMSKETEQTSHFRYFNNKNNSIHPIHLKFLIDKKII